MTKFILLVLVLSVPFIGFAKDIMSEGSIIDGVHFNPYKNHFITSFGFEAMKYDVPYEFSGVKKNFHPRTQDLYGARLGLGNEIYLGGGVNTTTKVEGYYNGTMFSQILNGGAQDKDVKFAYTKRTGQVYGFDASQSIGVLFNMKAKNPFLDEWTYLTVEPFVEAGLGVGRAYNSINYSYNLDTTNERYKRAINDSLTNMRLGIGVNFTSSESFFFFIKATQSRYNVTSRKIEGFTRQNGGTDIFESSKPKNVSMDAIMVYSLGGGYKF
jgi:hypothetical protein